jgi:hypothetical protein
MRTWPPDGQKITLALLRRHGERRPSRDRDRRGQAHGLRELPLRSRPSPLRERKRRDSLGRGSRTCSTTSTSSFTSDRVTTRASLGRFNTYLESRPVRRCCARPSGSVLFADDGRLTGSGRVAMGREPALWRSGWLAPARRVGCRVGCDHGCPPASRLSCRPRGPPELNDRRRSLPLAVFFFGPPADYRARFPAVGKSAAGKQSDQNTTGNQDRRYPRDPKIRRPPPSFPLASVVHEG